MGLFDKMFGNGAANAQQHEQRFNTPKQKYQSVLNAADQQNVRFHNLHVESDKLFIRATAPTEEAKNKLWDQIKLVNPNADDITLTFRLMRKQWELRLAEAVDKVHKLTR